MAIIRLEIEATDAAGLHATLVALAARSHAHEPAIEVLVEREASYQEDDSAREELQTKRTRRTKAQMEADAAKGGAVAQAVVDPFNEAVKESAAEVAAGGAQPAVTIQQLRAAGSAYMKREGNTTKKMAALILEITGAPNFSATPPEKTQALLDALTAA